jgi:hypothetical protein
MIVYCCSDLIFATKIHSTAEALGIVCRPARDEAALRARLDRVDDGKAHDRVSAVMIDLTLGEVGLELIGLAKGHDAGPEVVAFAPHVEVAMLQAAEQLGADRVMPRGAFAAQLPQLLKSYSTTGKSISGPDILDAS